MKQTNKKKKSLMQEQIDDFSKKLALNLALLGIKLNKAPELAIGVDAEVDGIKQKANVLTVIAEYADTVKHASMLINYLNLLDNINKGEYIEHFTRSIVEGYAEEIEKQQPIDVEAVEVDKGE